MGAGFYVDKKPVHVVSIEDDVKIRGWKTCLISRRIHTIHISFQDEERDPFYTVNLSGNSEPSLVDCNHIIIITYPKRFPSCDILLLVVDENDDNAYSLVNCSGAESKEINDGIVNHSYQTFKVIVFLEGVTALVITKLTKEDKICFVWAKKYRDTSNAEIHELDKPMLVIQKKAKQFYDLIFCEKKTQQLSYSTVILKES